MGGRTAREKEMEEMIPIDEIPQSDRRRVLEEDRLARKASTYFAQAQASLDDTSGGRYGAVTKSTVTGSTPAISYPKLPSDAPSKQLAGMPDEPALGYKIDDQEAIGEPIELDRSREALSAKAAPEADAARPRSIEASGPGPSITRRI